MLPLRGAVQPVVVRAFGDITFTAVGLSLRLTPHTLSSPATSARLSSTSVAATTPAGVRLNCTLDRGQSARLATVPVTAAIGHRPATPAKASKFLWQASQGGSFKGKGPAKLQDGATGTVVTCKTSATSGTMKFGRDLPGAGIASLTSVTFSTCSGPGGKDFTVTASASTGTPWLLNAQSYNPATAAVTATVSGIMATVSGSGCTATVAGATATAPGTVNGSYTDSPYPGSNILGVRPPGGTLHAWNVSGCSGLFSNGDSLSFTLTYPIIPPPTVTVPMNITPAYCPPFPINKGFPFNRHFKFPKHPHGSIVTFPKPPASPYVQGCAFIKGFSNVSKLSEAALVGPGFGGVQVGRRVVENFKANYFEVDSTGKLYFKPCPGSAPQCKAISGLPPVTATFLSFGFLPTTATLQITQVGTLDIFSVGTLSGKLKYSKILSLASIRVERALANGVPLNVGSDCHTVKPFKLVVTGKPPYSLNDGGVLTGTIKVPPFTGCGVGENIDPIFNATVSGPGNIVKLTQAGLCTDWGAFPPFGCPAPVPKPVH